MLISRLKIVRWHRWLSIGVAMFWLLQAITGVLIVFHWEMDDAALSLQHRNTDLIAIERRMSALAPSGSGLTVTSIWVSAGLPDRYDITVSGTEGAKTVVRVAGDGGVLRRREGGTSNFLDLMVSLHQTLLAGTVGTWIVGVSGMLLTTNLLMGLFLAWPRRIPWRKVLGPINKGKAAVRLFSWHRAIGLWTFGPALVIATTGTLLEFSEGVGQMIGNRPISMSPLPDPDIQPIPFSAAVNVALAAVPGSTLTAVKMPNGDDATYKVTLRDPAGLRRAYGTSLVFVDARNGRIRGSFPSSHADLRRTIMDALLPIHTGESFGLSGRLLVLVTGFALSSMLVTGIFLWQKRRSSR